MQRPLFIKILAVLSLCALLSAGVALAARRGKPAGGDRLSLEEAKALVNRELFHNELKEVYLHEITTDEVWSKLKLQVYKEGFLIDHRNIVALFNPDSTTVNLYSSDLDRDGTPELICNYVGNYGVPYNVISVYTQGKILKMSSLLSDFIFKSNYTLDKVDEHSLRLTIKSKDGNDEIKRFLCLHKEGSELVVDVKENG